MKKQVIKICQTAYLSSKCISSIYRFLIDDATKTLVTSYILSCLDYCNCLLMDEPNSVVQPLQTNQNFAARHPHGTSSSPLYTSPAKLHWLPISERTKYKVACMCFHVMNGSRPTYLSELLHICTPSCTLHSSSDNTCSKSNNTNIRLMAFTYLGLYVWNSLPQDLRQSSTLPSFETKLKTFPFSQYFHSS